MSVTKVLEIIFGSIFAYLLIGFLFGSFVAKFEATTKWTRYDNGSRWCESVTGFVCVGLLWPGTIFLVGLEQIAWKLKGTGGAIQNYIRWLRRDGPSREKRRGIEA